jgi:MFS family permease
VHIETSNEGLAGSTPEVESIWGPRLGRLTAGLLITIVAGAFEALAVATVLPDTVDDLGGLDYYGWILASFTLANLIGIVVAGTEIDRQGMVPPFLVGIGCFVVGLVIGGLAPSMFVLIVGRTLQGFASGMLISVAYAAVRTAYDADARPRLMALWSSAWVVPGLVGPAVAGFVAETIGWRWVFLGMIPFPLVAAALTVPSLRGVDERKSGERDLGRLRDAVLLAGGTAILLVGFGRSAWYAVVPLVALGAAVMVPAFRRLSPPGTLRARPGVAAAVACMILLTIGFFGFEFFIPLALTDLRHQSTVVAGLPLTATALTWTAGAWIVDRKSKVYARSLLVRTGLLLIAIGIVLSTAVFLTPIPVPVSFATWAIAGLGMGTCFSTLMLSVLDDAPEGSEGATISAGQLGNTLGVSLGVGVAGAVVAATSVDEIATERGIALLAAGSVVVLLVAFAIGSRIGRGPGCGSSAILEEVAPEPYVERA